jgi:hypothetical protein
MKNIKNAVLDAPEGRFGCCPVPLGGIFSIMLPFFEHKNPK